MSKDMVAIAKITEAHSRFMREKLYWEMIEKANSFERHPWSRRQTRADARAVGEMCKYLKRIANDLYLIRLAIKEANDEQVPA